MRSALAATALVVVLAGCNGGDGATPETETGPAGYPQEAVANFVSECRAQPGATEAACRCVIDELQRTMPYEEFREADEALLEEREPDEAALEKLTEAAEACRRT